MTFPTKSAYVCDISGDVNKKSASFGGWYVPHEGGRDNIATNFVKKNTTFLFQFLYDPEALKKIKIKLFFCPIQSCSKICMSLTLILFGENNGKIINFGNYQLFFHVRGF